MKRRAFRWLVVGLTGVALLQATLFVLWPLIDDNDPRPSIEQQLAIAAALVLFALPHIIAAAARRRDPSLLKIAGFVGIVLTLTSVISIGLFLVAIPLLLVPSVVYLIAGIRPGEAAARRTPAVTLAFLGLSLAAVFSLFITEDPRCMLQIREEGRLIYKEQSPCDPNTSLALVGDVGDVVGWSGSSDSIALHESLLSLSFSGAIIALGMRNASRGTRKDAQPPRG